MKRARSSINNPKWVSRSHGHAPKQEGRVARKIGGRTVAGSGCGSEKGDVRIEGVVRVECKSTKNKSFPITRKLIEKISKEASGTEVPVIQVDMISPEDGSLTHSVYVMPVWAAESLINSASEK